MKKAISILSVAILGCSTIPGFAQFTNNHYEFYPEENNCSFTDSQLSQVELVSDMFQQYSESKIVQRLFSDKEYQTLVRNYTDEFVMGLEDTLDMCRDGESLDYTKMYTTAKSMTETKQNLINYVETVLTLQSFASQQTSNDPAVTAFGQLRDNMIDPSYMDNAGENAFLQNMFNMTLEAMMTGPEGFDLDLGVQAESKGDARGTTGEGNVKMNMSLSSETEDLDVEASAEMDIMLVDDNMYLSLQDLDIQSEGDSLPEDITQTLFMANMFRGKYIEIPGYTELTESIMASPMGMIGPNPMNQQEMLRKILDTDFFTTISQIDNSHRAIGPNPLACNTLSMRGTTSNCLDEFVMEFLEEYTNGTSPITLSKNTDNSRGVLLDTELWEEMTEKKISENSQQLITRNAERITNIYFPMGEMGLMTYDDGTLDLKVEMDPGYSEDMLHISGTMQNGDMDLNGVFTVDGTQGTMTMNGGLNMDNMVIDMNMEMNIPNEITGDIEQVSIDMHIDSSQVEISPISIQAPEANDVITLDELMNMGM